LEGSLPVPPGMKGNQYSSAADSTKRPWEGNAARKKNR